jgi:NAD(P)-dependent dehydrogenase (short-subunit alcohol dehydrogenase family)
MHADVANTLDAHRMSALAVERFGAVDILVNNAGVYPVAGLTAIEPGLMRHVLEVNLVGTLLCTQAAVEHMLSRDRGGCIINITSIDAVHPSTAGLSAYDASKHGVWGLTKSLALELGPRGIRVNAIAPGYIETPGTAGMSVEDRQAAERAIPLGRIGRPEDIADVAVFLASDRARYMTGAQLVVDGGMLLT